MNTFVSLCLIGGLGIASLCSAQQVMDNDAKKKVIKDLDNLLALNRSAETKVINAAISRLTAAGRDPNAAYDLLIQSKKLLMEAEKEKMRANLLRAISHDIRTPLTSIIGSSTVYLENEASLSNSDKKALVSHILEDSNWLLNMVENLLSVTRINNETAKVSTSLEPVEEVLGESISRLKKRLPDAQVKVSVPDEFLMIPMDAILIEQVLINLMENAIVHSKSTKPIECFVEAGVSCVTFHVRDYGIGIPPEKLETIFDGSSSTTSTSTDGRKGMGIGLSICKTIITAHGGTLAAVNHADGAEFYFTLPKGEQNIGT